MKKLIQRYKKTVNSLRFKVSTLVFIAVFMLVIFLVCNNAYAIMVVRKKAIETNSAMMSIYMNRVDAALKTMENYWAGQQMSSDMYLLMRSENIVEYYTAQSRLKSDMESMIQTYEYVDDMFIYHQGKDLYIDAAKYGTSTKDRQNVKQTIKACLESANGAEGIMGEWKCIESNGKYYLVRIFQYLDIYMGGWVDADQLISSMKEDGFLNVDYLTLFSGSKGELGSVLPELNELEITGKAQSFSKRITGDRYQFLAIPSKCGSYSLVAMIRDKSILEGLSALQMVIILLGVGLFFFMIIYRRLVRSWILYPVTQLCDAMNTLQSEEGEIEIDEKSFSTEFLLLSTTFRNMLSNIKELKIDVYEENVQRQKAELQYQKAELQYLKLQMNPHFYINCLNVINNLSIINKNELICELTNYLGNHLRYTLEGNTVDFLHKEIEYVKNYLHIQEVRFGECMTVHVSVPTEAENVKVPPLIIQTFVENTIKYQVVAGEHTDIYISISRVIQDQGGYLDIEIWDSGSGFTSEVLERIKTGQKIVDERGEHYGIQNVRNRLNLIYQGAAMIEFRNHPKMGGAYILMKLPLI